MNKASCLLILLSILLFLSFNAVYCEIPKEVYAESIKAHRFWYSLPESQVADKEKELLKVETFESSIWQPYERYIVSVENIQKCKSGDDILSMKEFLCYRCPIIVKDSIVGFSTVKRKLNKETGIENWEMTGLGPGSEREAEYYDLLKQYPLEEGYRLHAVSFEVKSMLFLLLVTPEREYMILPASKRSTNFLIMHTGKRPEDDFVPLDQVLSVFKRAYENYPKR